MTWGMDLSGLPRISNYEEALAWLENQRRQLPSNCTNWGPTKVPLDGRRKTHLYMELGGDNSLSLVLYYTTMVRYFADGRVQVATYDSRASRDFLGSVAPEGVSVHMKRGDMWLKINTIDGKKYMQPSGAHISLLPLNEGVWTPSGYSIRKVAKVKFRKLPKIRKMAEPIKQQLQAFHRLGGTRKRRSGPLPINAVKAYLSGENNFLEAFGTCTPEDVVGAVALAEGVVEITDADYTQPPRQPVPGALTVQLPVLSTYHELEYV